ncbi:MAG TPA: type V CRISPR-associated protein Cas12a/Cpf1 [Turneriella sp.]|nr:type V CRISPR-associated protein Cas12a/Cpf1 [Turneriella sp.]
MGDPPVGGSGERNFMTGKKAKTMEQFTNLYSLSKTLRFELKPVGKTLEHIEKKGLLKEDEKRANDYQLVKKIIDRFHKDFMEKALTDLKLAKNDLEDFKRLYSIREKTDAEKEEFDGKKGKGGLKEKLRKQIATQFTKANGWGRLFAKELIKEDLIQIADNDAEKELIAEFKNFTTYFTGFHENRKNMYTSEEHVTGIAYRLIHENLPKFLDNLNIFEAKIKNNAELKKVFGQLEKELLNNQKITEIFSLNFFNTTLTQTGISFYNTVLGGVAEEGQKKIQGLNEYINLYNQKQDDKNKKIPKLKPLYKQILSDRESSSFQIEAFTEDNELLTALESFYQTLTVAFEKNGTELNVLSDFRVLATNISEFDGDKIFLRNDLSLTDISQKIFGDWSVIKKALEHYYTSLINPSPQKVTKKYENEKERWLKKSHFSIQEIENAIIHYKDQTDEMKEFKLTGNSQPICDYFKKFETTILVKNDKNENKEVKIDISRNINEKYSDIKDILNTEYNKDKKLSQDKDAVGKIKAFLDAIQELLHFVKPLNPAKVEGEKDEQFYAVYVSLFDELNNIVSLYNKTRNYLTKKPYSVEKYKLNFENSTLADGWDVNKETDNTAVLLRKDGLYYLAIMDKKHNRLFTEIPKPERDESVFQKVDYKLLPGANKMLPKVFFSEKGQATFNPPASLLEKYKNETHKKGDKFNIADCHALIDFFKKSIVIHEDWKHFGFKFSDTKSYEDLSGFYREVESQGYKVTFRDVSQNWLNALVAEGKLYLFQIYNKDFSIFSKGRPNLHTMYWKMVFDEKNLKDVVYKLNGEAELFYRKKSLNYDDKTLQEGHHVKELRGKFKYPIISNRRFALDKFQFHVPITMNFKAKGESSNINIDVLKYLKANPDVSIIGIDRGERHLLYLTLVDQKRNIIKQMTLNEIINTYVKDGNTIKVKTDYHEKLNQKEVERAKARESWGVIENIKKLKEGYLSHVVHVIAKMMVEHNAIVVMEDLNFGFKRGRFKVEKQVYQKFERMLIEKLNYLVFKDKKNDDAGGVLKAYQLTNKFESFKKLGKQSGFIFYVPAALTSKIDPKTGFVDYLKPRYESIDKAKSFIKNFESIYYNSKQDWFEFVFNYTDFIPGFKNGKSEWVLCSTHEPRYRWNPKLNQNKGAYEELKITSEFKALFQKHELDFSKGDNLKEKIAAQNDTNFFKELMRLLSTLLSLRHNNGKKGDEERDSIISPVEPFFNSINATEKEPQNADANGAYHIAVKGLWVLNQINQAKSDDEIRKVKLAISNEEWLNFVQKK